MITYFFLSVMTLVWAVMFLLPLAAYVALAVRLLESTSGSSSTQHKQSGHHEHPMLLAAS